MGETTSPAGRAGPTRRAWLRAVAFASAVAVAAAVAAPPAHAQECISPVTTCDGSVDLFPAKIDAFRHAQTLTNLRYANTHVDLDVRVTDDGEPLLYRFVRCGCAGSVAADGRTVISVPPARLYVGDTSTLSQVATEVGVLERVTVIGSVFTTYSPVVRQRVASGLTRSLITDPLSFPPNYTKLLDPSITGGEAGTSAADAPILGLVPARDVGEFVGATEDAIPFVTVGELEEATPLGRAEYVQYLAIVTDRAVQGNAAFALIEASYTATKALAAAAVRRPSVLTEWPYSGPWSQPGELTYAAALLRDANFDHRYRDDNASTSSSLSPAEVVDDFGSADLWINAGLFPASTNMTLGELLAANATLTEIALVKLDAVRCRAVWINQARLSPDGRSNDYFEEGAVRPDKVLADLVRLGHPTVNVPGEMSYYYKAAGSIDSLTCPHAQLPVTPTAPSVYVDTVVRLVGGGLTRWDVEDDLEARVYPAVEREAGVEAADVDVFFSSPPADTPAGTVDLTVRARRPADVDNATAEALGRDVVTGLAAAVPAASQVSARSVAIVAAAPDGGSGSGDGSTGGSDNDDDDGLSGGAIAGIVGGVLVGLTLAAAAAMVAFRRGRTRGAADRDAYWQQQEGLSLAAQREALPSETAAV